MSRKFSLKSRIQNNRLLSTLLFSLTKLKPSPLFIRGLFKKPLLLLDYAYSNAQDGLIGMEFCDFLAQDELIEIVPNFKYELVLNLINGDFGPFAPGIPTKVPLWMALNLSNQQKCKINLPKWLQELDKYTQEQAESPTLIKMPCDHWREIIELLSSNKIEPPHNPKAIIDARDNILKKSIHSLLDSVVNIDEDRIAQVKIKNITKFELQRIKKVICANLAESKNLS